MTFPPEFDFNLCQNGNKLLEGWPAERTEGLHQGLTLHAIPYAMHKRVYI